MGKLDGKVAVVTGASRGIGRSIAQTLARDGAHVVCLDIPDQGEPLVEVANEVDGSALQLDITDDDAPERLAEHLRERHGGADVIVHNAGVTRDRTLGRMSEDEWDMVIAINLTAQERINDALIDGDVLRPGGRIVSVSSVGGIAGNRGQANYATSKAGVIGLVEALAPELAKREATINAVAPGLIETEMTEGIGGNLLEHVPARRAGTPEEVAECVRFLASDGATYVTGVCLTVDGGLTA